jgi:UDP-N-acetylglucosamine 4-epimerase
MEAALKNEAPVIYGDGETSRDFTFVENAVQANIKSFFTPCLNRHEVLNIASAERTTLNLLWKTISELAAVKLQPIYDAERKGDVKHSLAAVSKAGKLINYHPVVHVTEGLKISLDWYKHIQHSNVEQ